MHTLEIRNVGLLRDVGYCSALVMEIVTIALCFYDGAVTCPCLGIEIGGFLRVNGVLRLLLLAYSLLILVLVVLLDAYVLVDHLALVVW
jgi:hypothetical protein